MSKVTIEEARKVVQAGLASAAEQGVGMAIAVVDYAGQLVAFERADDALRLLEKLPFRGLSFDLLAAQSRFKEAFAAAGRPAANVAGFDLADENLDLKKARRPYLLGETDHTARRVREGGYSPVSGPHVLQANSSRLDSVFGERWLAGGASNSGGAALPTL